MVYYIRFLKPPECTSVGPGRDLRIKSVVTVTTDLGESFCSIDLDLEARLEQRVGSNYSAIVSRRLTWHGGARALTVEFTIKNRTKRILKLLIGVASQNEAVLDVSCMPEFIAAHSDEFEVLSKDTPSRMISRRLNLEPFPNLVIWEQCGESIARHIWDAGVGMVASLHKQACRSHNTEWRSKQGPFSPRAQGLRVIELGSGCGIVGIALAQMTQGCRVLLTDLSDAMGTLAANINEAKCAKNTTLKSCELNWEEPLPEAAAKSFDLVLVSDCTYNQDSSPALVRTLQALAQLSEDITILVSLKMRNPSESIFFELMNDAGFQQIEHETIPLPDRGRECTGQELEQIEIYSYQVQKTRSAGEAAAIIR